MNTIKVVHVVYAGEILKAMENSFAGAAANGMTDTRFQPFLQMNADMEREIETVTVDKWLMDLNFRVKADDGVPFYNSRLHSALDVNAYLAIISHFGFGADYNSTFVRKLEPMISDVMLRAFRSDTSQPISPREFNGKTYSRGEFFAKFEDFLIKYGM
jgi:hypothetical protein